MTEILNTNLVMICGEAIAGKTASLRNIKDPEGVMYLNCEAGKSPPFKNLFWKKGITITDPYQIYEGFTAAERMSDIHTIIIDSMTFLMDMYVSVHVSIFQVCMYVCMYVSMYIYICMYVCIYGQCLRVSDYLEFGAYR